MRSHIVTAAKGVPRFVKNKFASEPRSHEFGPASREVRV